MRSLLTSTQHGVHALGRGARAGLLALGALALGRSAHAQYTLAPFKIDTMTWYIQVGWVINPNVGTYTFTLVPPPLVEFWSTPATLSLSPSLDIRAVGTSTHVFALHPGEAPIADTFAFDLSTPAPGPPFGALEERVYDDLVHPGGGHLDTYGAVVGGLLGTAWGPSLAPRFIIIHGSIGVHLTDAPPPSPSPFRGRARLEPPSGAPSPGNLDYPMGELITIVDPQTSRITLVVIVDCVKASDIGSVYVRQGPGGPILFDLKPQMQLHSFDPFGHALAVGDAALPVTVSQAIAAGHTWVSVQVASHPDGQITGALGGAPAGPFDSYCTAGTSSLGCVPAMHGIGTPSASGASGFQLACNDLEAQKTGLLFYGVSGPHAVSWGGGSTSYVCVQAPTQRTPAQSSGGTPGQCDGALMVDWNAFQASHPGALGQPFSAGQTIWSQAWYRDPPAVKSTNLSDGLSFTLGP